MDDAHSLPPDAAWWPPHWVDHPGTIYPRHADCSGLGATIFDDGPYQSKTPQRYQVVWFESGTSIHMPKFTELLDVRLYLINIAEVQRGRLQAEYEPGC